jgi:Domain of unknown function (DUF6249)
LSQFLTLMIPITVIVGVWVFLITAAMGRARVRELQIRERIAMIEKGMVPSPVADPGGFDKAVRRFEGRAGKSTHRYRSAGVTLVGVGLGLMLMIGFAADQPQKAVGIGGFIIMLGAAFIVNSMFEQRRLDIEASLGPEPSRTPPAKVD